MKRTLPSLHIAGTEFLVDIEGQVFLQKDDLRNRILFEQLTDDGLGYLILFDKRTRNLHTGLDYNHPLPEYLVWLSLPSLFVLDPVGMARLCHKADDAYINKYGSNDPIVARPVSLQHEVFLKNKNHPQAANRGARQYKRY